MAYDPQYAHEYYMKHRQLKGRKKGTSSETDQKKHRKAAYSGLGLSKEQRAQLKSQWAELKADLDSEKEAIQEAKKAAIDKMNEGIKRKIEALKAQVKDSLARKNAGAGVSNEQYKNMKAACQKAISDLRAEKKKPALLLWRRLKRTWRPPRTSAITPITRLSRPPPKTRRARKRRSKKVPRSMPGYFSIGR